VSSLHDSLNPDQKEAALYRGGPLLILAGAGTGKTRVIVHRIASLLQEGVSAGRILAVTFTNKAAGELRNRIDKLAPGQGPRIWVHTFHAFAARMLRQHALQAGLPKHFTVYDSDDQKRIIVDCLKELDLAKEKKKAGLYATVISRAKDELLDPGSYSIHAMAQQDPFRQTVARVYERYQKKLDASGGLDFGDLLLKTAGLLKNDLEVRSYYQKLFEHILVDEYQDTNHAQYIITKTLAAQHRNLCVVGDPDQSIYAWRGANIRNILEFENDFKDVKVVKLEQNYRSTPNILDAAASVIANNDRRHEKRLWTDAEKGQSVDVDEYVDEREEADAVVSRIARMVDEGVSPKEIAVFYRTNAQSRSFETAFSRLQVPCRVVGSLRFFERKEVKDALAFARAAVNTSDSVSLSRILNVPARGIGKSAEEALKSFCLDTGASLRDAIARADPIPKLSGPARRGIRELHHLLDKLSEDLQQLSPADGMNAVLQRTGYWDSIEAAVETDPDAAGRLGNLQELLNAVGEFQERDADAGLGRFLEDVALQSGADSYDASAPAVTLMTVHLAKGLEFPTVFVTGLEEGLFPIGAANADREQLEEERRLCYVAMTRAEKKLYLTHAATRRLFGRAVSNLPSRFILEASLTRSAPPPGMSKEPEKAAVAAAPPPTTTLTRIKRGMRVQHPEFGLGKIADWSGKGEALKVTIIFDDGRTKKLLLRYAPLMPA